MSESKVRAIVDGSRLGGSLLAPSRIGYTFHIFYTEIFENYVAYNIARSLSLLRDCDDGCSRSPVTPIKGPCRRQIGSPFWLKIRNSKRPHLNGP
jgi:hypothetical protein